MLRSTFAAFACALSYWACAYADPKPVDVPAGDLATALESFAKQAGVELVFSADQLQGLRTQGVSGNLPPQEAAERLIAGTSLKLSMDPSGAMLISAPRPVRPSAAEPRKAAEGVPAKPDASPSAPVNSAATTDARKSFWDRFRVAQTDAGRSASEAAAQSSPDSGVTPGPAVEEIVVTAQKRKERLQDVPMSISAISEHDIERRGIESILDLSRSVPGLTITESAPGQNRIFMRGVGNGNGLTSLVGVYIDEAPVTGMALGQLDARLIDLERVEVLRGPQGTLYGQGSAGGTLRFITRNPDLREASGRADVEAYGTAHGDTSEELTGIFNLPLVKDALGLRLSGTFADIGGWIDQPAAARADINDQKLRNVRTKLLWSATDSFQVQGTVIVHRNEGDGVTAGVDSGENVFFVNDPNARERFSDDYDIYNATMTYDFGAATLLSSTSYISSEKATAGLALNLGAVRTFNRDSQDNEVLTQELRLSSSGDTRLKWVVGSFYDRETLDRLQIIDLFLNGVPLGVQRLPVLNRTKSWSGFGDVSYGVTSRLDLGVGSRYFHDDRSSFNGVLYQTATFTSTDPRFYGTFALTPDIKLYANLAKGFRSGGFSGDPSGRRFQPEGIRSYELGIKGSRASGLRWELTAFYSEYEDVQAFALTSGVTGGIVNAGTAHPRGVDWLLAYDVAKLSLQASGNYTRARFSSVSPTTQTYTSGDRVDFIPEYSVAASAEYRVDWAADFPGFIRVDYNQVGPSALTDRRSGVIGFRTDTLRLFNARIGVEHGRWTGELFGNNLLDEDGVQDPLAGFGFGSRPRPRVIGVKVGATL